MKTRITTDKIQLLVYFVGISIVGSFLLSLPTAYRDGISRDYIDVLFTSVSAVCVTGLTTLSMDVYSMQGFITIMVLIELGGLGIISFVALYILAPKRRMSLVNRAVIREFFVEDIESDPRKILRSIITLTLSIEAVGSLILFTQFKKIRTPHPILDGIFHSISAFCNAGFSTFNTSLAGFRSQYILLSTIMILIVLGGLGFLVLTDCVDVFKRRKRRLSYHSRIVLIISLILIFIGTAIILFEEQLGAFCGLSLPEKIFAALFQSITPRTAGFQVISQSALSQPVQIMTIVFMFIGGSPGSIAGGVKTTTFFIFILYAIRGDTDRSGLDVRHRNIDSRTIDKAFNIVAKSMIVVFVAFLLLLHTESAGLKNGSFTSFSLLFETVSAFGTVGLSMGATPLLSGAGKCIIILTMLIGRIGVFAMAIGFAKKSKQSLFEYPTGNVMVG